MKLPENPVSKFSFKSRWKEELVCSCPDGSFILELTMGVPTVYLPSEEVWPTIAPAWAKDEWQTLHKDLKLWCAQNSTPLEISSDAHVF